MSLTKSQRLKLREMFGGKCAYCGWDLPENGWHADHIEPIIRKGEYVRVDEPGRSHKFVANGECHRPENHRSDNFFPSCRACNIHKSSQSLEDWRSQLEGSPRVLRDNYATFKHAERFGIVAVVRSKVVFHFELSKA